MSDSGLLARHSAWSIGAAATAGALLGVLRYDFGPGLAGLPAHIGIWFGQSALIALLVSLLVRRLNYMGVAVLLGGGLGALSAWLLGSRDTESLLFAAGAGVIAGAIVQLISTLEDQDVAPSLLMALFFFLVITTFWIAKSIKKGLFIGHYRDKAFDLFGASFTGAGAEQLAKVGNMLVAIAAVIVFTALSRRLRRERLVYVLAAGFVVMFLYFRGVMASPGSFTVWSFYMGGDLFNTMMVATFWAFLNDSVVPAQAKRIYGMVGFGGVLGGAVGATTVRSLEKAVGAPPLVLICALTSAAMAIVAGLAARGFRAGGKAGGQAPVDAAKGGATAATASKPKGSALGPALEGAHLVFASRYLLCIVAIVAIYEFCSSTLDYQWTATYERLLAGNATELRAHPALIYTITNWSAMLVQLLVTSALLRRFGVGPALLVLPLAFLGSSSAFLLLPIVFTAGALSVSDNSLNYSVNQSARESLYVPTSTDVKYKAKAFIDMFVQRSAKAVAVGLALIFNALDPAYARWLSLPVLGLLVVWIAVARSAGREYRELTGSP